MQSDTLMQHKRGDGTVNTTKATFDGFKKELDRLVEVFTRNRSHYLSSEYDEASLRQEFLNPLFRVLGWDVENEAGHIPSQREVEIESRTQIAGRQKRADYLFRTDGCDRFVCEAKKPAEELDAPHAFQAKRYAWNKGVPFAILTDFEEMKLYVVGGRPHPDDEHFGLWKSWSFQQYPAVAHEMWVLLARENVAAGSIDHLIEALPRKPAGKGRARQQWLIKPDRSRALDIDFLNFLDEARRELASDLISQNNRAELLEENRLNEAVQHILDRLLFLRICEDRDIDTGMRLDSIVGAWRQTYNKEISRRPRQRLLGEESPPPYLDEIKAPKDSVWHALIRHFRALDRRPPSHVPFFNGNLFKPHFSEHLTVSDEWLVNFVGDLSDEESPYLFNAIPVEILGTIYERFLGKVVRPKGRGVMIEEKPEVRKAGGVYYTPRYVVDYIVEQTVGKLIGDKTPEQTKRLRFLDPACGSGSFLIRVFERICEHWQLWLTKNPDARKKKLCWVDSTTNDVHLSVGLKREILCQNVFGVDLDAAAVEVTQLSLYLKMLEGENRTTVKRERELFGGEEPLLPPLGDNIKHGNSLIASDFSLIPEDLVRIRAFDWDVQFARIVRAGGFDAVVGNPPYVRQEALRDVKAYLEKTYEAFSGTGDLYTYFMERGLKLCKPGGRYSIVVSSSFLRTSYAEALRATLMRHAAVHRIVDFGGLAVFADAKDTYVCIPTLVRGAQQTKVEVSKVVQNVEAEKVKAEMEKTDFLIGPEQLTREAWALKSTGEVQLVAKLKRIGVPLGEYVHGAFFRGITSGLNAAFLVDEDTRERLIRTDAKSAELIHPVRGGEDVREYFIEPTKSFIIFTRRGVDIDRYPAVKAHLQQFKADLMPRNSPSSRKGRKPGSYRWYEIQDDVMYYPVFEKPKIVFPDICKFPRFCYDDTGIYLTNTAYALGTGDKYLLGILNSRLFWFAISNLSIPFGVRAGEFRYRLIYQYMEKIPIRRLDSANPADKLARKEMTRLVEKRLTLTPNLRAAQSESERATLQNAVAAADQQINELVYRLYGLTTDEIRIVEGLSAEATRNRSAKGGGE